MAQARWGSTRLPDPFAEFDRLQGELSRLFGLGNSSDSSGLFDRYYSVPVDVIEAPEEITILANVPGMEKKDIELNIASNILTITGEKKTNEKKGSVLREETWAGKFQRTLSLPNTVDPEAVKAELSEGVLRIHVGKRPETKPRQISVAVK